MVVIDTDFLIDFLKNKNNAIETLESLIQRGDVLYVTQINEYELLKGAYNSKHPEDHINKVKFLLSKFKLFLINADSLDLAARIFTDLSKKGMIIPDMDILIASICIVNNQILVTRNIKDFSRIEQLKLYK